MPYIPKQPLRQASTSSPIPPELQLPRLPDTPTIRQGTGRQPAPGKVRITGPKINPRTHEVDPADVYKALFGKELKVNELNGISNLVHPGAAGIATAG